jgi:Uncharacterized ACR, COG1993
VNETRVKAGDLADVELLRTQLAQLQFENAVRQAELRLTTAQAKLRLLIGRQASEPSFQVVGDQRKDTGIHRRIHRKGLLGVSDDKPLTIAAIDNEEKLRDVLPSIRPMIREGLIGLSDFEVIP